LKSRFNPALPETASGEVGVQAQQAIFPAAPKRSPAAMNGGALASWAKER
jgi:hypothetical protein